MAQHVEACICPRCRADRYQPDPERPENSSLLIDMMGGASLGFGLWTGFAVMWGVGWAIGELHARVPNFSTGSLVILLVSGAGLGIVKGRR